MLTVNPSQRVAANAKMNKTVAFNGKLNSKASTRILSKVKVNSIINSSKLSHVEKRDQLVHMAEAKFDKMGLFDKLKTIFK